ncbi:MerR family transcriptional regulator [Microbispora corallina]|uniref:HTH merR-type domain-containing protein n=1 Tax=Microbispora corallina TaxID=83302 RepID=A0ABQ4G7Q5_9ACTN|nr:MerR family transcriptional regulator [Microbispora corallina]GIH43106.1 hypothetical protein Mco01_61060 [Microbispora corallina]
MTIGVFARAANVTTSALRFYDDCGLVRPASVDSATGYRYYSVHQLDEVVLIRRLRAAGLPLGEVRRVLAGPLDAAEELLADHLAAMERAVEVARANVTTALDLIRVHRGDAVSLPGRLLAEAIGQVAPAVEATGDIPVLGGVLIEAAGGEVVLVATDRYRLAIRSLRAEQQLRVPGAAVVAATHLNEARPWIDEQARVRLRFTGTHVRLDGPGGERILPAVEETFPAYRAVLDDLPGPVTRVVAPRGPLLRALGHDPEARLDLVVDGALRIRSSARHDRSVAIPADITGEPLAVSFTFTTLHPALTAGIGPDVMLQISRPDLPVVVRSADDSDLTTLVMPVKAASGPDIKENREPAR